MTTMAISALFGLVLAGQGKAVAPPADWPLKILDAPVAEMSRVLGRPRDTATFDGSPMALHYYTLRKDLDVRIQAYDARVVGISIVFPTDPKDWRDALSQAGITASTARSARASRHPSEPSFVIQGLRGLKSGSRVVYTPSRVIRDAPRPRREEATLSFLAPGQWTR